MAVRRQLALIDIWAIPFASGKKLTKKKKTYKIRKLPKPQCKMFAFSEWGLGILACQTSWKVRIFARLGISIKRKTKCKI